MQLQVFASSGRYAAAPAGHFSAQQLHLLPLAGVGQGQGVTESSHDLTTEKREDTRNSNAATIEANNVHTLPSTPKPQTSKEVIQTNVQLLIEQLEAGHSEGLTAYLTYHARPRVMDVTVGESG